MTKSKIWYCSLTALLLSFSNAGADETLLATTCGSLHVKVHAVALPDNGAPPHDESLDKTWTVPIGLHDRYVSPDGWIVTQGYPNNGGSHSWQNLKTDCSAGTQTPNAAGVRLVTTAKSDIDSGVGKGTGAGSDYDTEWILPVTFPPASPGKPWMVSVNGVIAASNTTPVCSIRANNDTPKPLPTGEFKETISGLAGATLVYVACSQGHIAIFPAGPRHSTAIVSVVSDVTLSFGRP